MLVLTIISKEPVTGTMQEQIEAVVGTPLEWHDQPKIAASYASTANAAAAEISSETRLELFDLSNKINVDIVVQTPEQRKISLAVFDMDSTLIQAECIDLIAESVGVGAQVSEITEAAMRGELDFTQSLNSRVALLRGVPNSIYATLKQQIEFMPGARDLAAGLAKRNVKLAVLSGGFVPIAQWVQSELAFDHAYANTLGEAEGLLDGTTVGAIVDGNRKAELLQQIAAEHSIPLDQVIAVGDGSNDLAMMGVAGFGVAFSAKPIVQRKAPARLNSGNLSDILYLVE